MPLFSRGSRPAYSQATSRGSPYKYVFFRHIIAIAVLLGGALYGLLHYGEPALLVNANYSKYSGRLERCLYISPIKGVLRFEPGSPALSSRYCPHFITLDFDLSDLSS